MEKLAKKPKITCQGIKRGSPMSRWKLAMACATIIYLVSFLTPCIWEHYSFVLFPKIYPPHSVPLEGWFWSFMAVIHTTWYSDKVLMFNDYWFNPNERYQGWLGVFISQILTLSMALITIFRKKGDKKLGAAATTLFIHYTANLMRLPALFAINLLC